MTGSQFDAGELPEAQLGRPMRADNESLIFFPSDRFCLSGTITLAEWRRRHAANYGEPVEDGAA